MNEEPIIHETDGIRWFIGTGGRRRTEIETETIAEMLYESERRFKKRMAREELKETKSQLPGQASPSDRT